MKELENLTKNELKAIVREQEKRLNLLKSDEQRCKDLENELMLLKFLYEDYVFVKRDNENFRASNDSMSRFIQDLQDLCDRQQKIIDSRYD